MVNVFQCQNFSSYLYLLRSFKLLRDHEIYHGSSSFLYEFFQGRYNIKKWKYTSRFIPVLLLIIIFVCWEACTNFPVVSENVLWSVKNTFDMKTNLMCQQQFKHFRYIIIIWKWMIVQCYATIEYVLYWIKTNRQIF